MKKIFVDIGRCTACKSCEIACAVEHSSSKNLAAAVFEHPSPRKRIHVEKALSFSYPGLCMHCTEAPCITVCPTEAMTREPGTGAVTVNEARCLGCWMCTVVCPVGAVSAGKERRTAVKCDLCGPRIHDGKEPACVEACPTHALVLREPEEISRGKRRAAAETAARAAGMVKDERE